MLSRFPQSLIYLLHRFAQSLSIQWFHQIAPSLLSVANIFAPSLCSVANICSLASLSRFPFNGSIKLLQNLHSRGPTKQHFYVWEPRCGYLHKVLTNCFQNIDPPYRKMVSYPHVLYYSSPQFALRSSDRTQATSGQGTRLCITITLRPGLIVGVSICMFSKGENLTKIYSKHLFKAAVKLFHIFYSTLLFSVMSSLFLINRAEIIQCNYRYV